MTGFSKTGLIAGAAASLIIFSSFYMNDGDELAESMQRGKKLYAIHCQTCHMEDGKGMQGVFPPLAQSDYMMADRERAIQQTKRGVFGEIVVNGITYNGMMPAQSLNEKEVADVMNYIQNSWGNKADIVTVEEVEAALKK